MATVVHRSLPVVIDLLATFIDSLKRQFVSGFTPTTAVTAALSGTGYATTSQAVTTTENFTAAANAYAGCWLITATKSPCLIVSHPAAAAAPLVFTVVGAAPSTAAEGFQVLRAPTPVAAATVHYDRGEQTVTTADASTEDTAVALCQALHTAYNAHIADALAHTAADGTNTVAATRASIVSTATAITAANQIKAAYNAHRSTSGVHPTSDTGNAVSSSNASDAASLYTLLNEMKADFNAHLASGISTQSWRVTSV